MKGYLLDTNVLSEFQQSRGPDARVETWLRNLDPNQVWVSALSLGEIRRGIERLAPGRRRAELTIWLENDLMLWFEDRVAPVSKEVADRSGFLAAQAQTSGRPVPVVDCLIAATAVEYGLTLVTRNVKDFAGLGVELINPWEA